jgi:hypothetical protein
LVEGEPSPCLPKGWSPTLLSDSEVLTLAVLAQWPRFRSERDFWRFASSHLRSYFPNLCSQSQLNRRVRALEPVLRQLQRAVAQKLTDPAVVYRIVDTTLLPAIVRVRASRKGLFCGQATFGRCRSKTEWVYGFKVALVVDPEGVVTAFGLAPANCDERPIGDALVAEDRHDAYLADKGFSSLAWERRWLEAYGALVWATPKSNDRRGWSEADRRWAAGKRQIKSKSSPSSRTSSPWNAIGRRRSAACSPAWPPKWPPTLADNYSIPCSIGLCVTSRIS